MKGVVMKSCLHKLLGIWAVCLLLTACADGPWLLESIDRQSYVGKPIETVYRAKGREPDYIEEVSDGRVYRWLEDKRYVTSVPTGTTRNNNDLTYHYQERVEGGVSRNSYLTDKDNVMRDVAYRFVR